MALICVGMLRVYTGIQKNSKMAKSDRKMGIEIISNQTYEKLKTLNFLSLVNRYVMFKDVLCGSHNSGMTFPQNFVSFLDDVIFIRF